MGFLNILWNFPFLNTINILFNAGTLLTGMVFVNYTSYRILDFILKRKSASYPFIEYHNQRYVVKNLTKSVILFGLLTFVLYPIFQMLMYDEWDNQLIHTVGTIYVSTDLSGLLFVPKLPEATKKHHFCVLILGLINIFMDYKVNGLHRAFISLTILSMIPYLVNTYLGMRYLEGKQIKQWILKICLWLYSVSVLINCILQFLYVFWIIPNFSLLKCAIKTLYLGIYYNILSDDIKLIQYLHYKYKELETAN